MFTGIVEAVGRVVECSLAPGAARLAVSAPFAAALATGESVAVDGCCLTALASARELFEADLSPETLARTSLASLRAGDAVNLERALKVGERLSGHLVQGHVDGVVALISSWPEGGGLRQRWSLSNDWATLVAPKGSITLAGVSLTVAALGPDWFEVALVPATLAATTLASRRAGDRANVEIDVIAKHLARMVGSASVLGTGAREVTRFSTGAPWEGIVGYCRAVRVGSRIVVSGTAPVEPDGSTHAPGNAEAQARRCAEIILRAVRELGGPEAVVVRTRMFVTDVARWEDFARAHAAAFGAAPPATTMVEVARLIGPDMLIEMEAEAEVP